METPLNIPNDKDQFEIVPYVKDMTNLQLKVCIKRMAKNIQSLANQMEGRRRDVSIVIDKILDGKRWVKSDLDDRYVFGAYEGYTIRFDTLTKQFDILDKGDIIKGPIQGVTVSEVRKAKKESKA